MQCSSVFWILIIYAILAPTLSKPTREKRSLSHIKKFLMSNIYGSNRKKHIETSIRRKPLQNYDVYVVPERQRFVIEGEPKITKSIKIDATKSNDNIFFSDPLRQIFEGEIFREAYSALRGLISMLPSGMVIAQETNSLIEDVSEQIDTYAAGDALIIDQSPKSDAEVLKRPIFNYERKQILGSPRSVLGFWGPIVSMPRKYSYEQTKGETVEKFTLDKNSDVIVTQTRVPMVSRPACVDDRIKDIIQSVPTSAAAKYVYSNIEDQTYKSPVFVTVPNRNKMTENSNFYNLMNVNGYLSSTANVQSNLLKSSVLKNRYNSASKNPQLNSEPKFTYYFTEQNNNNKPAQDAVKDLKDLQKFKKVHARNEDVQRYDDQLWNLAQFKETKPFTIPNQSHIKQFKISDKSAKKVTAENANLLTHYDYKQETNNGVFKYGETSNVSIVQDGEKFVLKMSPSNNTSVYNGDPIVVAPINDTAKVIVNAPMPIQDNEVNKYTSSSSNIKEMSRGDIPE